MNDMRENNHEQEIGGENIQTEAVRPTRVLWIAAVVLLCLVAVAAGFIIDQHKAAARLSVRNQDLTTSLTQTRGQMQALGSELSAMKAEEAVREQQAAEEKAALARHRAAVEHARYSNHRRVVSAEESRWRRMQAELAANQKAIASTQQQVQAARSEFQNNLTSTRNELGGSIAKNHAELVALERKGERNYYEFDLYKQKQFQRVGPIGVSLRKTNAKHQFCNLQLLVNDKELTKKHVDLYEPVLFYADENGGAVQLVINQISKNHMHGYVSTPKYQERAVSASNSSAIPAATAAAGNSAATADVLEHRPVQ
jgi:hypothetical protein